MSIQAIWFGAPPRRRCAPLGWLLAAALAVALGPAAVGAQDVPAPTANLQVIPQGSLIIPMDNAKQALVAPFNLRAYGLVNDLLQNSIPLKWAIRAGKAKDAVDFTAQARRIAPSVGSTATLSFSGGPIIVPEAYANAARTRITAFGNSVAVYELMQDVSVDIRHDLTFKPRPFVNATNSGLATDVLDAAGVTTYVVNNDFALLAGSCYTIAMEPHNTDPGGIPAIKSFVQSGGNFLAQCASIINYENNAAGRFLTTLGLTNNDVSNALTIPNPDLPFSQFEGALEPAPGGSVEDLRLATGSVFQNSGHAHAYATGVSPTTYAALAGKLYGGQGGMAFYLGGHDWTNASTLAYFNGRRMMLNAVLTPPTRPLGCGLTILLPDLTIAKTHGGNFVQGRTGTYTVTVTNAGQAVTADTLVVTDTLPAGLSYVSASGSGWSVSAAGQVVTAIYPGTLASGAGTSFTLTVSVGQAAMPAVTNRAWVSGGGEFNSANNLASDATTVVPAVTGRVFEDADANGVRGPAEHGLPNVQVQVTSGAFTTTVTTDTAGIWFATGVPNGLATVNVIESTIALDDVVQTAGVDPSTVTVVSDSTVDAGEDGYSGLSADVSVTKTGPATALARDTLRYVIVTSNAGPSAAPAVVVRDTLPAGVVFVAATRGGALSGSVITWPVLDLAIGASVSDTVWALAPANATTSVNVAAASGSRADPNAGNNDGSAAASRVSTTVSAKADLAIVKTDGRTTVNQLDTLTYTITVTNAGPSDVSAATVTDNAPAGLTAVTWTCTAAGGAACGAASGSGNIAGVPVTVPVGGTATFVLQGTATTPGLLSNTGTVAAPAGVTDPAAGNDSSTDNNTVIVVVPIRISSAANQTFTVGAATTPISTITITDATNAPVITALRDLRIAIPATLAMRWDTLDLAAVIGGPAAAKVSGTVRYEDAGRTLVLDVLSDFVSGEQVTVSGLGFTAFTAPSLAASLTLEANNDNLVSATDDKTKTIASNQAGCTTDPVTTVAQLRSAVANAACNPVNVVPGTYNLTSDGQGTLTIARSTTIRNSGGGRVVLDGGGAMRVVFMKDVVGTVTLKGLTLQGGRIGSNGAGLHCDKVSLVIEQSTISENATTGDGRKGAGLFLKDCSTTLRNVTVSGNSHLGRSSGAGIYVEGGTLTAINATVANNVAHSTMIGGGIFLDNDLLVLTNSLVADNLAGTDPQVHRKAGTVSSNGWNLVEGGCTGCLPGDRTADPVLGSLADNGGDSWTQALLPGSPAINTALTSSAPPVDQRNVVRPQGSAADIGAYEAAVPDVTVTPDGAQLLKRLPSNGVSYTASFVASNTGAGSSVFGLKAFSRPGSAVTIVSVNGVAGDTTATTIPASSALVVPVVYTVGSVAAGVVDSVYLRARSASYTAVSDTGFADLAVVRPSLTTSKTVAANGAIVPGTELTYLVTFANAGSAAASSVVLLDSLPPAVQFKPGSVVSTPPAGVSVAVDYSSDLGSSWTYLPVSGGCGAPAGYDRCVNRIRWRLLSALSATPPNHAGSVGFIAQIR